MMQSKSDQCFGTLALFNSIYLMQVNLFWFSKLFKLYASCDIHCRKAKCFSTFLLICLSVKYHLTLSLIVSLGRGINSLLHLDNEPLKLVFC